VGSRPFPEQVKSCLPSFFSLITKDPPPPFLFDVFFLGELWTFGFSLDRDIFFSSTAEDACSFFSPPFLFSAVLFPFSLVAWGSAEVQEAFFPPEGDAGLFPFRKRDLVHQTIGFPYLLVLPPIPGIPGILLHKNNDTSSLLVGNVARTSFPAFPPPLQFIPYDSIPPSRGMIPRIPPPLIINPDFRPFLPFSPIFSQSHKMGKKTGGFSFVHHHRPSLFLLFSPPKRKTLKRGLFRRSEQSVFFSFLPPG